MMSLQDFKFSFDGSACNACGGKCCVGESGYIFCTIKEMQEIALHLGILFDEFTKKYVKKVGYKFSLIERASSLGHACVFFDPDSKKCQIYEVRPKQCRTFPFWDIYRDGKHLDELKKECMGIGFDKTHH